MNSKKPIYYLMIFKKALLILPRFLLTIAVTAAILIGATFLLYQDAQERRLLPRLQIGCVVPDGDAATAFTARMIANMDALKNLCDFAILSEEEADSSLLSGRLHMAFYLTPDIYNDVNNGVNTPVRIRVSKDSGMAVQMFKDLVYVGLSILQSGESANYALGETARDYEMTLDVAALRDNIASQSISLALNRAKIYTTYLLSAYGNISMAGFYVMTVLFAIVCLFLGMGFGALYDRKERTVDQCLRRMGIRTLSQTLSRLLSMGVVIWVMMVFILFIVGTFTAIAPFSLSLLLPLIPLAFSVAAFIHMGSALTAGEQGSLFYLLLCVLLFVLGGGLFPSAYLPPSLKNIAAFLPIKAWQQYLSGLLWNGFNARHLLSVVCFGTVMAVLGSVGLIVNEKQ